MHKGYVHEANITPEVLKAAGIEGKTPEQFIANAKKNNEVYPDEKREFILVAYESSIEVYNRKVEALNAVLHEDAHLRKLLTQAEKNKLRKKDAEKKEE